MSLSAFLARLTRVFEDLGLEYMIVGSLASTVHGVARSTQDVDIVVALARHRLADLLAALPQDDYYVSDTAAEEAVRRQSQFNRVGTRAATGSRRRDAGLNPWGGLAPSRATSGGGNVLSYLHGPLRADDIARARQTSPAEKLLQALDLMAWGIEIQRAAFHRRHPEESDAEIDARLHCWLERIDD